MAKLLGFFGGGGGVRFDEFRQRMSNGNIDM